MKSFLISMMFSVLFELLKEKKVAPEFVSALAKAYLLIQARSKDNNQLAQLIEPKPNA